MSRACQTAQHLDALLMLRKAVCSACTKPASLVPGVHCMHRVCTFAEQAHARCERGPVMTHMQIWKMLQSIQLRIGSWSGTADCCLSRPEPHLTILQILRPACQQQQQGHLVCCCAVLTGQVRQGSSKHGTYLRVQGQGPQLQQQLHTTNQSGAHCAWPGL